MQCYDFQKEDYDILHKYPLNSLGKLKQFQSQNSNISTYQAEEMCTIQDKDVSTNQGGDISTNQGGDISTNLGGDISTNHSRDISTNQSEDISTNQGGVISTNQSEADNVCEKLDDNCDIGGSSPGESEDFEPKAKVSLRNGSTIFIIIINAGCVPTNLFFNDMDQMEKKSCTN